MNLLVEDLLKKQDPQFRKAIEHFQEELKQIRTGRASGALVEHVEVEYYGTRTPLLGLASITVPEPRQLLIKPWDKGALPAVKKAIEMSKLGINPIVEGDQIRIPLPPLTEERRQELAKQVQQFAENTRVAIRNIREDILRAIKELEAKGEISEDDKFKGKDRLEKSVEQYNQQIKEMTLAKEKEVMTV
jgi:ribosome recycling factor